MSLTPTESRLLYALAANLGQTVTTETLLARGWADTEDADPSYVWVTMRRLRQKVELDPNKPVHLLTVRGIGYRLVAVSGAGDPVTGPGGGTDDTAARGVRAAATAEAVVAPERVGLAARLARAEAARTRGIRHALGNARRRGRRRRDAGRGPADDRPRDLSQLGPRVPDPPDARADRRGRPARRRRSASWSSS